MQFERSFLNWREGIGICCWQAPSKEELSQLFDEAGTPYDSIVEVEEYEEQALN